MDTNLLILCLLSTVAVLSKAQSNGEYCQTPDNRNGNCVSIRSCDILYRLAIKRVLFPEDRILLQQSKCGIRASDVCCPVEEATITTFTPTISITTSTTTSTTPSPTTSTTPSPTYTTFTRRPNRRFTTTTITTTTTTTTITPRLHSSTIRISAQKCIDYADYAFNKSYTVNIFGPAKVTKTSNCGFLVQGLVVGGEEAKRREYPHMALIGFGRRHKINWLCGGTLISEQFVLSAAHCSGSANTGPANYVRLGEHDLSQTNDANHVDLNIIERIVHPNVAVKTYNDIILFKLDHPVEFNYAIRPACLPQESTVPTNVSASGWGKTHYLDRKGSSTLQKVDLTTFSPSERLNHNVSREFSRRFEDGSIVFAGHLTEAKDTCQGDSGGPLQALHDSYHCTYIVLGVTSTGYECGHIGTPAIYTAVYKHLDWIEETVWPNE